MDELKVELVEWVDKRQSADGWLACGQEQTRADRPDFAQPARWLAMCVERFWAGESIIEQECFHRLVRLFSEHRAIELTDQDDAPKAGNSSSGGVPVNRGGLKL